ncbi:hypothetical protein FE634_16985 [Nocardioides dongxiaopingii]|uniref:DUF4190 domain-containing protein n=1 Tax=Nocardioides sp. S-1144 TaxID=2582905 RepID=UPI00110F154A|nr:DUF4190 domain-containing protein [Nocardioides sp. S-1144]QCW51685.1 hypothetical protein FE634_16985 [Nocardioides sp. S-1144]
MSERPDETEPIQSYLAKGDPSSEQAPAPEPPTRPHEQPHPGPAQGQPHPQSYPQPYGGQPYGGQPGYQPYPPGAYSYGYRPSHSGANTAMALGIASIVCLVLTFVVCVTLPGVLCGPFAIALAIRAQKEMRAAPGHFTNESAATTGLVTGIIGTVLGVGVIAVAVLYAGFVVSIFSLGTT